MNNLINIKSFFNFLSKNKGYTAINVFGLSISLMFVILIGVYVGQEMSTDKFQRNADRIYALGSEDMIMSAGLVGYPVMDRFPEVEKVCPVVSNHRNEAITINNVRYNAGLVLADSCFFNFFSFDLVDGDKARAIETKNYAVVSESFAKKAFSGRNPIGESIQIKEDYTVTVTGIMKDIRNSTIPYADIALNIAGMEHFNPSAISEQFHNAGGAVVFFLAKEGTNFQERTDDIKELFSEIIYWPYFHNMWKEVTLTPLDKIYFSETRTWQMQHGDKRFVLIFLSVGLLILAFAIINYINLTVAQAGFRAKEMATRRLLGSSRKELFFRLILESTLVVFISFTIGLLLAYAAVPFANELLDTKLFIVDNLSIGNIGLFILLILLIGFISGLLPAMVMSSSKPIDVVRGTFRQKTKMVFSKVFITFQNIITIAMIAAALIMITQVNHLINAPLNYNKTNILDVFAWAGREELQKFGNEASNLAFVKSVGYTQGTPFNRGNNFTAPSKDGGRNLSFQILKSDQAAFDMLQIEKIRDNNIASQGYYMTQYTMNDLGLTEDSPSFSMGDEEVMIAGILEDFVLGNISSDRTLTLYEVVKIEDIYPWSVLIEVQGDPIDALNEIKALFNRITGLELNGEYFDKQIELSYRIQSRTAKIVSIFTLIAILISFLGLLAMSTYFIQQRSREIAVRKVFGSSESQILKTLVITFLNYVLIAFVIATPIVWYVMNDWLSDYSYRITLTPVYFIIAGLFCLLISLVTVFTQSWQAANENPIKRLKAE
jgi:ABC-type transport system, involved in lipoprotein release, permease component